MDDYSKLPNESNYVPRQRYNEVISLLGEKVFELVSVRKQNEEMAEAILKMTKRIAELESKKCE